MWTATCRWCLLMEEEVDLEQEAGAVEASVWRVVEGEVVVAVKRREQERLACIASTILNIGSSSPQTRNIL